MEKLNIAEILKNCPKGMELDCTMYEDVYFDYVDELNIIHCYIQRETHKTSITFNQYGTFYSDIKSKCVIFPKSKTTWEGFQRPFKEGDVLYIDCNDDGDTYEEDQYIFILKNISGGKIDSYCYVTGTNESKFNICYLADLPYHPRFATEEEKQKLFDTIKANGYKWNADTKTLEKLKVNKFDITTLKPFNKVLVRSNDKNRWNISLFGYLNGYFYCVDGVAYYQCIPFEDNKHLLGTTNDCDEYFKTWE